MNPCVSGAIATMFLLSFGIVIYCYMFYKGFGPFEVGPAEPRTAPEERARNFHTHGTLDR